MAFRSNISLLWLCLGASLSFIAYRRVIRDLYEVRKLTEIRHDENDERMISQGTEDALKLDTLQKLTESPTYELRGASLRILSERATKEASRDLLLEDLKSKNKKRRDRALTAIHFLVSSRALARSSSPLRLKDHPTFEALIDCLCNFIAEHTEETGTTNSPILPKTRPPGEKKALAVLNIILAENIPAALEAGIIRRWLSRYPFPCLHDSDYRGKDLVVLMKTYWSDDTLMSSIVTTLLNSMEAVRQLRRFGLIWTLLEDEDQDDVDSDVWMVNGDDTAGRSRVAERLRLSDESLEEQALRRRRREAMVFGEAGRPLGDENIIQPVIDQDL
ncbi:hypothetical protein BGW36DRAFT_292977 [Talaromyces proteolyticus]|uniref:Cytoskeleton-associated protein n=1 Tax=Talaromyces proteolyticus TaxID=1131652 RepID=A0AAD4Q381_9EURO|nr:uncharacterized protein BGW36DRAFT_292977 [Talaromyces proteolyticus]KAH8701138.1 hypothetical protein BGW36DRAFT_292977 [Talaromyces proteolyticus]